MACRADHPRTRGVYVTGNWVNTGQARIIPARAGFTRFCARGRSRMRDHPRTRGVYGLLSSCVPRGGGSSPHARGLPAGNRGATLASRIIPARAGFTDRYAYTLPLRADHPRTRGVYIGMPPRRGQQSGSSPHARGLPPWTARGTGRDGIIPARAGFTSRAWLSMVALADHPRTRGVYWRPISFSCGGGGSSPHARGLPTHSRALSPRVWIIPARAGFTGLEGFSETFTADHPRTRGVYRTAIREKLRGRGSSPHARGLPNILATASKASRIIPARAGFTRPRGSRSVSGRDHPRTRGVYSSLR